MRIILAATHHDPDGRLYAQTERMLPLLRDRYDALAITVTPTTTEATIALLRAGEAGLRVGETSWPTGHLHLGRWRRAAIEAALTRYPEAKHIHFCDLDRVLHWAEYYPEELDETIEDLQHFDFCVLGRTLRAFESHPRAQCATEALANQAFALVWGDPWDVTAASRGLSNRAARLIVAQCDDDTVGSDCSWPLIIRRDRALSLGYWETDGLEFETLDRYGDEIAALGDAQAWIDRFDADPQQWLYRMDIARAEVVSAIRYA
jgi:hypothetical protein